MNKFVWLAKRTTILVGISSFLAGVILGLFVSPNRKDSCSVSKKHCMFSKKNNEDYSDIFSQE